MVALLWCRSYNLTTNILMPNLAISQSIIRSKSAGPHSEKATNSVVQTPVVQKRSIHVPKLIRDFIFCLRKSLGVQYSFCVRPSSHRDTVIYGIPCARINLRTSVRHWIGYSTEWNWETVADFIFSTENCASCKRTKLNNLTSS